MKLGLWQNAWLATSILWITAVAYVALWQYQTQDDRVRYWADSIEGTINGDPMVPRSAKELRARLGDEKFIAAAPAAYPQVDLRALMRRYEADMATRRHFDFRLSLALALLPPLLLYVFGVAYIRVARRFRSLPRA